MEIRPFVNAQDVENNLGYLMGTAQRKPKNTLCDIESTVDSIFGYTEAGNEKLDKILSEIKDIKWHLLKLNEKEYEILKGNCEKVFEKKSEFLECYDIVLKYLDKDNYFKMRQYYRYDFEYMYKLIEKNIIKVHKHGHDIKKLYEEYYHDEPWQSDWTEIYNKCIEALDKSCSVFDHLRFLEKEYMEN